MTSQTNKTESETTTTTTTTTTQPHTKSIFTKIDANVEAIEAGDAGCGITEIESLCMDCYKKVFIKFSKFRG